MKPFRFGMINEQLKAPADWIEHVRRIESHGFSTLLIRDHFVPDFFGDQYAPLIALTVAASVTTRLRLGTMVIGNDYRHPAILAKEIATLDQFSGGRVEFGIGAGWLRSEYEQAGMDYDSNGVRVSRLEEAITVYKGLLSGAPFSYAGEYYAFRDLETIPHPCQQPHPPIMIGAGKKRMLQLAGREADILGLLTTSVASGTVSTDPSERLAESVREKLAWVKDGAGSRYDTIELSLIPTLIITDNQEASAQRMIDQNGWQGISVDQVLDMPAVFIGTVDEIVQSMVTRRERYGFSYYVFSDHKLDDAIPVVERLAGV